MADKFITVRFRERIDQVAERSFLGDPLQYAILVLLNADVDLFYPHPELQLQTTGENPAAL